MRRDSKSFVIDRFAWVDSLDAYCDRLSDVSRGIVPVLRPANPDRAARWSAVLTWYGVRPSQAEGSTAEDVELPAGDEDDVSDFSREAWVIALDDQVAQIARRFADVAGRSFCGLSNPTQLSGSLGASHVRSIVVVATARALTFETLTKLQENLRQPWGILCARDEPALTFVMAKQLISGDRLVEHGCGAIDALTGTTIRVVDHALRSDPVESRHSVDSILDGDWRTLGIVAHGEGSHVNLNLAVCCGASGEVERDLLGAPLDACGRRGEQLTCKRVHDAGKRVVRFGDLRAQTVSLFSCIGFSTTGEVYPSDNSLLLDAAEGYPSTVVTTDRVLPISPSLAPLWLGLVGQRYAISDIVDILNEITVRQYGCAAYLRFGDPQCDAASTVGPPPTLSIRRLPEGADHCEIFRMPDESAPGLILPGRQHVVVMTQAPMANGHRLPLIATREFEAVRHLLEQHAQSLLAAASLQASVVLAARTGAVPPDDVSPRLAELASCRAVLESAIDDALYHWDQVRVTGLWTQELDGCLAAVAAATESWDACMAELCDACLFDRPFEEIHALGRRTVEVEEAGQCSRCASPLRIERRASALTHGPLVHRVDCPLCGCRESFVDGSWRLDVAQPRALVLGTTESLDVRAVPPPGSAAIAPTGWLLTRVMDRGTGHGIFQAKQPINSSARVEIAIPDDLTMELHIVKFIVVHDLGVSYLRYRVPAVPASHAI